MENRSHIALVGSTLAILIAALIGYILWATPGGGHLSRKYDILFDRSVAGLSEGSPITFAGVSVGRVKDIRFDPADPRIVRVRAIITNPEAPIVQGTTAALNRDLFGTALITLDGAKTGAPPIVAARDGEIAIIPVKRGGGLMDDPVSLVEKIATTTDRLNAMLSPSGRKTISDQIAKLERKSAQLADDGPAFADGLARARATLRNGGNMASAIGEKAEAMDRKLQATGPAQIRDMRASMASARAGMEKLDVQVKAAGASLQTVTGPGLQEQVRDLRGTAAGLRSAVEQVDRTGMSGLVSTPKLPDYKSQE